MGMKGMVSPCKKFKLLRPSGTNCYSDTERKAQMGPGASVSPLPLFQVLRWETHSMHLIPPISSCR